MNCQEAETVITDLERNVAVEEGVRSHVKECPRCTARLAEEQRLTAGLRAWSAASREEQAPPRVEENVLAAFRRKPVRARHGRRWLPTAAAGSIAAAILLFKLTGPPLVVAPTPPQIASVTQTPAAPVIEVVAQNRRAIPRPQRRRRPAPPETAIDFLTVTQDDGWTPLDGGRLVRMKLPRSALSVFGLPVDEERRPERIEADVMLSNDGVLRAIRFVK